MQHCTFRFISTMALNKMKLTISIEPNGTMKRYIKEKEMTKDRTKGERNREQRSIKTMT